MAQGTNNLDTKGLVGQTIGQKYVIGEYVTGGSFGSFHFGFDQREGRSRGERVAIKLEKREMLQPQLFLEFGFYRVLGRSRFIPKMLHFGPCGPNNAWNALVMELLGPSLRDMNEKCGGTYSLLTTVQLTIQLLNLFEYVHDHGVVYRDIKPENFLIGPKNTDKWCTVCLIDLGFCKSYMESNNSFRSHIPFKKDKPMTGTVRYMSVNNHGARELSRRDDIEAMMYMIVFLHKGQLPWQGVNEPDIKERYRQIGVIKYNTQPSELCANMPKIFTDLLTHARKLRFEKRPRYRYYIAHLHLVLSQMGFTMDEQIYDWDQSHNPKFRTPAVDQTT